MLKKYFFKRVHSYFRIMIIPTLILFLVMGCFFVLEQQKFIKEQGPAALSSFEDSLEASLYNMGYQLDVMMSNTSYSLALKNLLGNTTMEQRDRIIFDMLKYFFNSYESAYSYIDSVYLYIDGKDRFMTSASGQIANIDTYYDQEWYDGYINMEPDAKIYTNRRWIQRYTYDEPVEVISIYYRNTYLNGVIVINVDKGEYGKMLRNILISDKQKVFLMNTSGDVICTTDTVLEESELENWFEKSIASYEGDYEKMNNRWITIGNNKYYMYVRHSEYLDIYQVSAISREYMFSELQYYVTLAALVLILDIVISLLLSYVYTRRSFYYIEECVNIFSAAERGEKFKQTVSEVKDEYGMILNNIIFLHLKNSQMQLDLLEKQHLYEITEMMALQLQINPHFIFNTLQIMDFEIIRNLGPQSNAHNMIQQLSKVVKYAFTEPTEEVTLKEELAYLKAYLEIQKVRFSGNAITYFEVDDTVLEQKVFRLLLQPMLENCFEHGMRSGEDHIVIKIKIYDKGETLYFAVIDNGIGMSKPELENLYIKINNAKSKNIGLTNLNRRLILHYGENSKLIIQSKEEKGTIIHFTIPKQEMRQSGELYLNTKDE